MRAFSAGSRHDHQHGSGRRPVSHQEEHDDSGSDLAGHHRQLEHGVHRLRRQAGRDLQRLSAGPGYWGKTFFIWPPDPDAANDWRKKFFFLPNGTTPCNNNLKLWSQSEPWNNPTGNYIINYKAILNWIVNTGPNPFPSQLRAGNILYYTAIPTDVPASAYTWSNSNSQITNQDQRFWKEYIDFVLGVWRDPFGNVQTPGNPSCSYGPDFTCRQRHVRTPCRSPGPMRSFAGADLDRSDRQPAAAAAPVLVRADDHDPVHARHGDLAGHGPRHLDDRGQAGHPGRLPGHPEQPSQRPGVVDPVQPARASAASRPRPASSASRRSCVDQQLHQPDQCAVVSAQQRHQRRPPLGPNGLQTPRAHGDYDGNTATSYGLMLAYNQFSSSYRAAERPTSAAGAAKEPRSW